MVQSALLDALVNEYFGTRPNLGVAHPPLCIFFLACSGSGKSTLRRRIVEALKATYVCNDEVRQMLERHPEAVRSGIGLKDIVTKTWMRVLSEAPNKMVVFDSNVIRYYRQPDSYILTARSLDLPLFVINLHMSESLLKKRIIARGIDTDSLLSELPTQLNHYERARSTLSSDYVLVDSSTEREVDELLRVLSGRVEPNG